MLSESKQGFNDRMSPILINCNSHLQSLENLHNFQNIFWFLSVSINLDILVLKIYSLFTSKTKYFWMSIGNHHIDDTMILLKHDHKKLTTKIIMYIINLKLLATLVSQWHNLISLSLFYQVATYSLQFFPFTILPFLTHFKFNLKSSAKSFWYPVLFCKISTLLTLSQIDMVQNTFLMCVSNVLYWIIENCLLLWNNQVQLSFWHIHQPAHIEHTA